MLQNAHPAYAELHCLSAFSFQRGASTARELFERARQLGYRALAITDEASLAGIVRALEASRQTGVRLIVGSEMQVDGGPKLVLLAQTLEGYSRLCHLITLACRRALKGEYHALRADFERASNDGLLALWLPSADVDDAEGAWVRGLFPGRARLAVELHRGPDDAARLQQLRETGARLDLPLVASGDVHMHARNRRALQDVLTAIRCRCTVTEAGMRLYPNGERHLRTRRDARCRQGDGSPAGSRRSTRALHGPVGRYRFAGCAVARARLRSGFPDPPQSGGPHHATRRFSAPPVTASGRLRDFRTSAGNAGTGRERGDGRPHGDPVGQGRSRHAGPAQGRLPRARDADRGAQDAGPPARIRPPRLDRPGHSGQGSGGVRDARPSVRRPRAG